MPHINDLIDFTIGAFIVHDEKVLLINHLQLKRWLCVGGHIELNEDPIQALFREIEEESGIKAEDLTVLSSKSSVELPDSKPLFTPNFLDIHGITDTHKHIGMVYFMTSKIDQIKLAEKEHSGIRWFSEEDLENPEFAIREDVKFYCKEALKTSSNT